MSGMKPWMVRRLGETVQAWNRRLNRTCYVCGRRYPTIEQCDRHEQRCRGGSTPTKGKK